MSAGRIAAVAARTADSRLRMASMRATGGSAVSAGRGGGERVGGLERRGDELVERDALRRAQTHVALDLAHRPAAQHRRQLFAHGAAPAGRGGLASGLAWGGLARGSLARGGIGAGAIA